jgi:hypothetical protein
MGKGFQQTYLPAKSATKMIIRENSEAVYEWSGETRKAEAHHPGAPTRLPEYALAQRTLERLKEN